MTERMSRVHKRLAPGLNGLLLCMCLCAVFSASLFAATHTVHVNDGSVPGLVAALEEAAGQPPSDSTVIVLSGKFVLPVGQGIPSIFYGDVTIRGGASAAVVTAEEGWVGPLFAIGEDARLRLANLEFIDIRLEWPGLIENRGELEINRVQFQKIVGITLCRNFGCYQYAGRIVTNHQTGQLRVDGVSFIDSGAGGNLIDKFNFGALLRNLGDATLSNVQVYLPSGLQVAPFANEGSLEIVNGSFYSREAVLDRTLLGSMSGTGTIANSIVVGFTPEWCEVIQSLGHNLVDNSDCPLSGENDLVGVEADLIFVPVEANWNPQGREILTNALEPLATSVAVDSGAPEYCTAGSLLSSDRMALDGDGDGVSGCDRGAVERVPATLDKGGINGLYFNPQADGHYVYIAETTYTTMVMWTTFDNQGRQAWVFGIGGEVSPSGRLITEAYINRNGAVRLDGTLKPANAAPWGRLEIRMQSCNRGRLIFDSDQPGFGSGEFPIQRLAIVDLLECVEGP